MNTDSGLQLEMPPTVELRQLEPLTPCRDFLRTYLSVIGKPLAPYVPPQPVEELCWSARYRIKKPLGQGAQGVVYLAERQGVDGYYTSVALKLFYRHPDMTEAEYSSEMRRIATQAQRVSEVQHDNLVSIRDFVALGETRVMVLEWVDGLDVSRLLEIDRLERLRNRLSERDWLHLNDVIVTRGEDHCRLKPGIAVDIVRGCLGGLSALHHRGIVHCDMKPANIMVKRRGAKKIIDIDSSCIPAEELPNLRGTPYYMAPEQLQGKPFTSASDIASLGYVLLEMLTGRLLFRDCDKISQLLEAKTKLPGRLDRILPAEIRRDSNLWGLVNRMIALDPKDRFPDADAADLDKEGAVRFHRHLVTTNLSTEYDRELAWWFEILGEDMGEGAARAAA